MNTFKDATLEEAHAAGCDTVQLKYKGMWTRNEVSRGLLRVYSDHDDTKEYRDVKDGVDTTLLGNLYEGRTWVYDCWLVDGNDVKGLGYRDRYALAHVNLRELGLAGFSLVRNFPIMAAKDVWNTAMTDETCGIVFRRSNDTWNGPVLCQRYYKEAPRELV